MNNRYEIRLIDHEITFETRREKKCDIWIYKDVHKEPKLFWQ
jgi:hypothetical protein